MVNYLQKSAHIWRTYHHFNPYPLASDAGTIFLPLCVQPIQSIHLKLDLRPTCSATHIPLLVDCKAPL